MKQHIFFAFAFCAIFLRIVSCGKIIEKVKEDLHKVGENVDCAFRDVGNFLGIGIRGPCEKGTEQGVGTEGIKIEEGFRQSGLGNNGLDQSGLRQGSYGQGGLGQNGFGQNVYGKNLGLGQNSFGQNGFGQNSGWGQGGYGREQGSFNLGGFGKSGSEQGRPSDNGLGQTGFNRAGPNGLDVSSFVQGEKNGFGNIQSTGYGSKNSESSVGLDGTENYGKNEKFEGKQEMDMRFDTASSSSTGTPETSTNKKVEMNGRRIISAHSNCQPGYVADSRGRCRETF